MKVAAVLLTFATAALAQRISIGSPSTGQTLLAGQNISVSVLKPETLSASTEIGISILLHHCTQTPCEDASQTLGSVLYAGSFNPQRAASFFGQPVQNFNTFLPDSMQLGPAVLSVVHANLIGAGPTLFTEIANVTVHVT